MRRARVAVTALATSALVAGVIVPVVGNAAGACSSDWPMFQHDAARTASAGCTDIGTLTAPTLAPGWFVKTDGAVTAEPAVGAGSAYVGDSTGLTPAVD